MSIRPGAQIQAIVDDNLPRLLSGEITLEAILADHPEQAELLQAHLKSALWLCSQPARLEPHPDFVASGKQRLINTLKTKQAQSPWQGIWHRIWRPRSLQRYTIQSLSYVMLVISLALVFNSLILASRLAIPGDWLYPAKLGFEQFQLLLTVNPQAQAHLQIDFTQRRTTEIVQLVLEDDYAHLPGSVSQLKIQVDRAVSDLDTAEADDASQAQKLEETMIAVLENETFILTLLRDMQPTFAYVGLNQAIAATTTGLAALQN